jgi:hypothetical protein
VIYLENNPAAVSGWLRQQGLRTVNKSRTQEKDRIQLLTAGLSGDAVLIGEEKVVANIRASQSSNTPGSAHLRHKAVVADMSNVWKSLVELTFSTLVSYGLVSGLRWWWPSVAFFAATPRGNAVIIASLIGMPLFASLRVLWTRNALSKDWKVSWIAAVVFLLTFYVILSPSTTASPNSPEYWNLGVADGFKDVLDAVSDTLTRLGLEDLKIKVAAPISTQAAQNRLKELFSEKLADSSGSQSQYNAWLSAYDPLVRDNMWIFQLILTVLCLPVGLSLFISIQRQIKAIFQSKGSLGTPAIVKVLQYFNVLAVPLFVCVAWSPFLPSLLSSYGLNTEPLKLIEARRNLSMVFVALQVVLVRLSVQLHLDTGKDITELLLSMSLTTPNRGLSIQANLRALAKTIFVVGLECISLPLLQFALLFTNHWLTNAIYLSTVLVSWPIAMILMFVQSRG